MKAIAKILLAAALSFSAAFTLSNCAVMLIGAAVGTVVYLDGELKGQLNTDMKTAVDAVSKTGEQMALRTVSRTGDLNGALYVATDKSGRKIRISLTPDPLNARMVEIGIRVGNPGNEEDSRRILAAVEKNL